MKKKFVQVKRQPDGEVLVESARWCSSALCRLVGLQFRRRLGPGEGLILVYPTDSIQRTSIHMLFVFTSLAAIWVNSQGVVTSAQLAKPWRPYYASPEPARYVIEASPAVLGRVMVGDRIKFE